MRPDIVRLDGRLGNQIFQCAFAIARAARSGRPFAVDAEGFGGRLPDPLRSFAGDLPTASADEVRALRGGAGVAGKASRTIQRCLPPSIRSWILQRRSEYVPEYTVSRVASYFDGYWQSFKYFADQEHAVRSKLYYRDAFEGFNSARAETARKPGSVSLHVRRGDYLTTPGFAPTDGSYFKRALDLVNDKGFVGSVLVFSDDPLWCKENLDIGTSFELVEGNDERPQIDLALMALCEHHIGVDSTFSWWGAWLGCRPSSVSVFPSAWFPSYGARPPLDDIYPPSWHLLGTPNV